MHPHYRAAYTSDLRNVPLARNAIARFAGLCGFSDEEVFDIRVASGEALSNAVEHGRTQRSSGFAVFCDFEDGELTVEIRDNGAGFTLENRSAPPIEERTRGFGIPVMRTLMDTVRYERHGASVRLVRRAREST